MVVFIIIIIVAFSGLHYAADRYNPAIQCGLGRDGSLLTYVIIIG